MRTELRKIAFATLGLLCAAVPRAATADTFDLLREGSLYICPGGDLVNGQPSVVAGECLQNGARFGASQLRRGNAQSEPSPYLGPFWEDNLYLYNPTSGAPTFLGAFTTPISFSYGGESPFFELPFGVQNLVRSLISRGDLVIDVVSESGVVLTMYYNGGVDGDYADGGVGVVGTALTPIPEPTTWTMMLLGLGGMGAAVRLAQLKRGAVLASR